MTPILDLSLLILGILIYLALATKKPKTRPIKGSKIIVQAKAKNHIIHIGTIERFDGDVVICYKSGTNGREQFAAWASHLFWSDKEQAFIERI